MKQLRLSILLTLLISMVGVQAFAAWDTSTKVQVNGLYYYLDNDNHLAQVTSKTSGKYTGNITIPSSFSYNTITYSVTSIDVRAFYECSILTSVTIPNSVTSIGNLAFLNCPGLTSIIVESGNTKYDSRNNCNAIVETASNTLLYGCKNTVIPNTVTSISNNAFVGCSGLASITIPNSVTSIGDAAFGGCSGLTSMIVVSGNTKYDSRNNCNAIIETASNTLISGCKATIIPNSVTSIGHSAFYKCSELTSINIPNSVTSIDGNAFYNCSGLTSVNIPNTVTSIGSYAFSACTGLTSVTIGSGVTSIGERAFVGCSGLTSVTVDINSPLTITSSYTFSNRANATLYVPAGSKSAYEAADYWKEFKEIIEMADPTNIIFADANVKAICVAHWDTNGDGELSYDEAAAVTTISNYFKNNTTITSFDEFAYFTGVTSIGNSAFSECVRLTSVTIPNSVTSIGNSAFGICIGLTSITIPNSVTSIGGSAFDDCRGLTSITIGNSVTSIGAFAFQSCSGVTSITIPNSVTSIGGSAFNDCSGLTSVTIGNSVTSIGESAFSYCPGLTSINIESGNPKFDSRNDCNAIIETASNTLLYGCKNTIIPNGVTSIGEEAFHASGLTSITIPNSVTSIGVKAFWDCTGLTSVTIGNSVTSIGWMTFFGCSGLTSVTIPNSVTSIGYAAFGGCSGLTSVTIPNSVTSIGQEAFSQCSGLTSVTIDINTPLAIAANTFSNRANATLYVPADCKSAYEAANYWKEFKEIVETIPASVTIAMKAGGGAARNMIAYSSKYALDFTDIPEIKAYIACGYNWKKEVMLVHVKVVPPYTGMVIKTSNSIYDGGEYEVPTTTEDYYFSNLLVPVVETQTVTPTEIIDEEEFTNFAIGTLYGGGIGFVRLTSNWTAQNKSYLRVPTSLYNSSASARQLGGFGIVFEDDEATGISNLNDNVNDNVDANAPRYNIAGQRVGASYKGVVIQNGKKILIK